MSYSFTVQGATKDEVREKVAVEFDKIVASQSVHATERQQAVAAADSFLALLPDNDAKDVQVVMHGSVGGDWVGNELQSLQHVNCSVTVSLVTRVASPSEEKVG